MTGAREDPTSETVYQSVADRDEIVAIDLKRRTVQHRYGLAPGHSPQGLAVDAESGYLYIACANQVLVLLFLDDGKVYGDLKIGAGANAVEYLPQVRMIVTANASGSLTVIRNVGNGTWNVVEEIPAPTGVHDLTADPTQSDLYLACSTGIVLLEQNHHQATPAIPLKDWDTIVADLSIPSEASRNSLHPVVLDFETDAEGNVKHVVAAQSSGVASLDKVLVESCSRMHFKPPTIDGIKMPARFTHTFAFTVTEK